MDISGQLKALYARDSAGRKICDYLTTYSRNRTAIGVDNFAWNLKLPAEEVKRVFQELQNLGLGRYVMGRRFEWSLPLTVVARVATGTSNDPLHVDESENRVGAADNGASNEVIRHAYNLRPDYVATIVLPASLTVSEANRLADFIRTLPFTGSAPTAGTA